MSDQSRYHRHLRDEAKETGRYPSGKRAQREFEAHLERQAAELAKKPMGVRNTDNEGRAIPFTREGGDNK